MDHQLPQPIIHCMNGSYQGQLSVRGDLEGKGIMIDDDFNCVICSQWSKSNIGGNCFIKLSSQLMMWGQWKDGKLAGVGVLQVGPYRLYIPPKKGDSYKAVLQHVYRNKLYIMSVERSNPPTEKREFKLRVQKTLPAKNTPSVCRLMDMEVQGHLMSPIDFLSHMEHHDNCVKLTQNDKYYYVCGIGENTNQLGVLLERKNFRVKSMGAFQASLDEICSLNGVGLCRMNDDTNVIGVFKDNMLVKEFSAHGYSSLTSPHVHELLAHEHMKSMEYQHSYLYFMEIRYYSVLMSEIQKYVEMFERLRHEKSEEEEDSSVGFGNKYQQMSQETIIEKVSDYKLTLRKQLFSQLNQEQKPKEQIQKKPGFIYRRSPTNTPPKTKKHSRSPKPTFTKTPKKASPPKTFTNWRI